MTEPPRQNHRTGRLIVILLVVLAVLIVIASLSTAFTASDVHQH